MARSVAETVLYLACILGFFLTVIVHPLIVTVGDALNEFNQLPAVRLLHGIEEGSIAHGIAAQPDYNGCKSFSCPGRRVAVRTPSKVESILSINEPIYCACAPEEEAQVIDLFFRSRDLNTASKAVKNLRRKHPRRAETVKPVARKADFTYVPPPKTDITAELLAESLTVQPQDTATVGSIMPRFQDGVISFGIQLNGLIAPTMNLNASTSLPCSNIGAESQAQPDLVLRPKDIENGTTQTFIPDCNIIAVNMYTPNVINYWVMNGNGSIFSLVGNNKVTDIDQLNSTASTSLVLRAQPAGTAKRDLQATVYRESLSLAERAMSIPGPHTALMSAEACAAMKCINNGNKAAVFNPFTKTCWCKDPVYVETGTV